MSVSNELTVVASVYIKFVSTDDLNDSSAALDILASIAEDFDRPFTRPNSSIRCTLM